jgi:hypothetical protein
LEVIAQHRASSNRQSTATVSVKVQNINDCKPKFDQLQYEAFLSEESASGTFVLQVLADNCKFGEFLPNFVVSHYGKLFFDRLSSLMGFFEFAEKFFLLHHQVTFCFALVPTFMTRLGKSR